MALTKISTDGVKDDAITKAKIPADQIEASELATGCIDNSNLFSGAVVNTAQIVNNAVTTNEIADEAVTLAKLPHGDANNDGKFLRANNGADPTFETVSGTTINNNADNRVITGSGTANTLEGESNLIFDGNRLGINNPNFGNYSADCDDFIIQGSGNTGITINSGGTGNSFTGNLSFAEGNGTGGSADATRGLISYKHNDDYMSFHTDVTERMRIDSSGNVLIGTTTAGNAHDNGDGIEIGESNGLLIGVNNKQAAVFSRHNGQGELLRFQSGNTDVGSIDTSGSGVNYTSGSDYRLKENIVALTDGITRLKTLKPSRFNFKTDKDKTVDGFIAHEVTAVPEAVTGTKDEVDADNKPIYQGIDLGKLVPLLTSALQEAIAKIETLETKVAALEAT